MVEDLKLFVDTGFLVAEGKGAFSFYGRRLRNVAPLCDKPKAVQVIG